MLFIQKIVHLWPRKGIAEIVQDKEKRETLLVSYSFPLTM